MGIKADVQQCTDREQRRSQRVKQSSPAFRTFSFPFLSEHSRCKAEESRPRTGRALNCLGMLLSLRGDIKDCGAEVARRGGWRRYTQS